MYTSVLVGRIIQISQTRWFRFNTFSLWDCVNQHFRYVTIFTISVDYGRVWSLRIPTYYVTVWCSFNLFNSRVSNDLNTSYRQWQLRARVVSRENKENIIKICVVLLISRYHNRVVMTSVDGAIQYNSLRIANVAI